jgi:hypothetical protein
MFGLCVSTVAPALMVIRALGGDLMSGISGAALTPTKHVEGDRRPLHADARLCATDSERDCAT